MDSFVAKRGQEEAETLELYTSWHTTNGPCKPAGSRRTGLAFEDLDSSFAAPNYTRGGPAGSRMPPKKPPNANTSIVLDDSRDELDFLSQPTSSDSGGNKTKRAVAGRTSSKAAQAPVSGSLPSTSDVLKNLKFKKKGRDRDEVSSRLSAVSSCGGDSNFRYPRILQLNIGDSALQHILTEPSFPRKGPSPDPTRPKHASQNDAKKDAQITRPKRRPGVKSNTAGSRPSQDSGASSPTRTKRDKTSAAGNTQALVTIKKPNAKSLLTGALSFTKAHDNKKRTTNIDPPSSPSSVASEWKEPKAALPRRKAPEKEKGIAIFPSPVPPSAHGTSGTARAKGKGPAKAKNSRRVVSSESEDTDADEALQSLPNSPKPAPFPMSSQDFAAESAGPSGLPKKGNGKDFRKGKKGKEPMLKVKPFPMSTQDLKTVASSSTADVPRSGTDRSMAQPFPMSSQDMYDDMTHLWTQSMRKRRSSDSDGGNSRKKRKDDEGGDIYEGDEDTVIMLPCTDPRTLCPFCDTPLPTSPTPRLKKLLAIARKKSSREARPTNPLGRKAPFSVFISVCERHKFESEILPEAERKGWPKSIDWSALDARVRSMESTLRALIDDPGEEDEGDLFIDVEPTPRTRCVFWKEVVDEMKEKGSRAVTSVSGQFASFEKARPGYYGELGSVIIHQTLYDLFPPATTTPTSVAPLTVTEFIQRVLVPEVGVRLIMEDNDLTDDPDGMEEAVKILRESATYGVAMFPLEEADEGGRSGIGAKDMAVADQMMMERAKRRRKELEDESTAESEAEVPQYQCVAREEVVPPEGRKKKTTTAVKDLGAGVTNVKKAKTKVVESSPPEVSSSLPKPRPRPIHKNASTMSLASEFGFRSSQEVTKNNGVVDTDIEDEVARSPVQKSQRRVVSESSAVQLGTAERRISPESSRVDINLCSSNDEGEDRRSRKRGGRQKVREREVEDVEPPCSTKTPKATRICQSFRQAENEDAEDTPRPVIRHPLAALKVSESFYPLRQARQRNLGGGVAAASYAKDTSLKNNPSKRARDPTHSWLLSDTSHSSMESIGN